MLKSMSSEAASVAGMTPGVCSHAPDWNNAPEGAQYTNENHSTWYMFDGFGACFYIPRDRGGEPRPWKRLHPSGVPSRALLIGRPGVANPRELIINAPLIVAVLKSVARGEQHLEGAAREVLSFLGVNPDAE